MKDFPESFGRTDTAEDDYRTIASMIAMACARTNSQDGDASADLPFKDRLLRCRQISYKTQRGDIRYKGICGRRRFCPFCNYLKRQEALLTYVPAFDRGYWYSMTISSTADLDLDTDELTYSWDAGKAVVRALIQAGHFQGAYWTEELHLESLYPDIRVLPHCHVLFHAFQQVSIAAALALARETFQTHFRSLEQKAARADQNDALTPLEPSIELEELPTPADLYKWSDYLTKTLRVVDAYTNALEAAGDEKRWLVNFQFEQFLAGLVLMLEEDTPPEKKTRRRKGEEESLDGEKPKNQDFATKTTRALGYPPAWT